MPPNADALDDIRLIKFRFYERYLTSPRLPKHLTDLGMDARQSLKSMREDGSWPDLAYNDTSMPGFRAYPHLVRLETLARAYRRADDEFFELSDVSSHIHSAINFWLRTQPYTDHDWYNVIGIQRVWMKVAILLESELSVKEAAGIQEILRRPHHDNGLYFGPNLATGQNLTWMASAMLAAACLANNAAEVKQFSSLLLREIRFTTQEGIQVDGSFHQHGPLLYSGGYGHDFSRDNAEVVFALAGTRFAADPAQIEALSSHILDGQRWMIRGQSYDFGVIGREIVRVGKSPETLVDALDDMASLDTERRSEFEIFAHELRDGVEPAISRGNRLFWRSDFMAHYRPGYYASSRMCSTRIRGNESGNGEGYSNYHLGDGALCLMKDGREYADLYPFWDWKRIPGVTCAHDDVPLPRNNFGDGAEGRTDFVGGVSDGEYGLTAFDYDKDSLRARQARFFFDEEIVCLGAGISGGSHILTSLEQCRARGAERRGENWVLHRGVGYLAMDGARLHSETQHKTGCWQDINTGGGSTDIIEDDVFSVWLDHGEKPLDAHYAYCILPHTDADTLEKTAAEPPILTLTNTSSLQTVWHPALKILGAVFYECGTQEWPEGILSVNAPCAVLWRAGTLWVSDPSQKQRAITLTWNGKEREVALPEKEWAGQSVQVTF